MEPCSGQVEFAGHRVSYRMAGEDPALVLVKPHLRPKDYPQLQLLSDQHQVIQIEPLGFGASDRPVAGGTSLVDWPTDAWVRRMDREGRVPLASRVFWHYVKGFDWLDELGAMPCPRLVYVGGDHRTRAGRLRRYREPLRERGVTVMEFEGLDDRACERGPDLSARVVPAVVGWLDATVGRSW